MRFFMRLGVGACAVVVMFMLLRLFMLWPAPWNAWAMKSPAVYEEAARTLAAFNQSVDAELHSYHVGTAWLPQGIRDLGPSFVKVSPDYARVEMGGGFHHYGYLLEKDNVRSDEKESYWNLTIYREDAASQLLDTVVMDTHARITDQEYMDPALAGYDEAIRRHGGRPHRHQEKMYFLLTLGWWDMAKDTCQDAVRAFPDHWWPQLTLAFMAGRTDLSKATRDFSEWVGSKPSFSHYFYLSYFLLQTNQLGAACDAIEDAIRYPLVTSDTDRTNIWFLAYNAAVLTYQNGRYPLTIAICDAVERRGEAGNYRYPQFLAIRAASHAMAGEHERAIEYLEMCESYRPTSGSAAPLPANFTEMKEAILQKNTDYIGGWDENEAGDFDPYDGFPLSRIQGRAENSDTEDRARATPE